MDAINFSPARVAIMNTIEATMAIGIKLPYAYATIEMLTMTPFMSPTDLKPLELVIYVPRPLQLHPVR